MAHLSTAFIWPNNANGEYSSTKVAMCLYWTDGGEHKMDMRV